MLPRSKLLGCASALGLLAPALPAQFNNAWTDFAADSGRIRDANGNAATYILSDPQEKDMHWGDLNNDGWVDLVIVRKQPFTTTGAFPNYLLMNEGGLLVDRSAQYASASDVAGDSGFLTPTNDRDVVVVDVNLDGWLDVVTATTMPSGQPKHITHPRVYLNQGASGGNWLGLRFENNRIPTMSPLPNFCSISAGDVDNDGDPDLYFADYGSLEDKLLLNNGNGFFADSGTSAMSASMLSSGFGTSSAIADLNGDGAADVVRGQAFSIQATYNNPASVGTYNIQQTAYSGSSYHVAVGDLNNDSRPDIIVSDDGTDRHVYNTGNDALNRVIWGPFKAFQFLTGGDDGIGGTNLIVDIDLDGWNDAIITNVDVDIPGCGGRAHIYHNPGGTPGAQITLLEEAEQAVGGWRGAKGLLPSDLDGMYDFAVFDIDHDGDNDMVFGRCAGTFVWINQANGCPTDTYPYGTPVANSTGQPGRIDSSGTSSISADDLVLHGSGLPGNKTCLFIYGTQRLWTPAPFGNGLRYIGGSIQRMPVLQSDSAGNVVFNCNFTVFPLNTLAPGSVRDFQLWYRDPSAGGSLYNVTDALEVSFCP